MKKSRKNSTQERPKVAPYDKLGWVRSAYEHAYRLIVDRLSISHQKRALQMTDNYLKTWKHVDKNINGWDHDRALLGVEAMLFKEHPASVLAEITHALKPGTKGDVDIMNVMLDLNPTVFVRELIDSASDKVPGYNADGEIPLATVLALYAVQTMIPGVCPLPTPYFDLTRNSLAGWMIQENEVRHSRGTCSVTGAEGVPTMHAYHKDQNSVIEVSSKFVRENQGWKAHKNIEVVAVKQIGMPMLASCPVCVLRRANRPTEDDPNVPAFPFSERYLDENEQIMNIGNPVNSGQRVMTMAYLKVYLDRKGNVTKTIRRQCPACMAVAIKEPAGYLAYIQEMQCNRGKGPVTADMIREWRREINDAAMIRYQTSEETKLAMSEVEADKVPSSLENKNVGVQRLLVLAVKLEEETPGLLNHIVSFKKSDKNGKLYASLKKGIKANQLEDTLEAFDMLNDEGGDTNE